MAFVLVLAAPFLVRGPVERVEVEGDARALIVVTPHIEQIRQEFGAAFTQWHAREYGQRVEIDWRTPGGTSEIVRQLQAQYSAAAQRLAREIPAGEGDAAAALEALFAPGTMGFDLFFGGGTYDHGRVKNGITIADPRPGREGERIPLAMSEPVGFAQDRLDGWFGENRIGHGYLYDPEQYWIGTALSGFGIVYNRDLHREMGIPEPRAFRDLTDPRYIGMIALADPRQSGSVTTTYDSILNNEGWEEGWRVLREMAANARYYASAATKPPIDVSQGEAAAGLAIDFYGRGQAQAVMRPGETAETSRVGYVDPEGATYIDADPISLLRGGPEPELARRFIEFCLTDEAQVLWQLPSRANPLSAENPVGPDGGAMGPRRHELRRMPVRRAVYERYVDYFIDRVDPFTLASETSPRGWRSAIPVLMPAFGIDTSEELRRAWRALNAARRDPGFPGDVLGEMERLFYAMPVHTMRDGRRVEFGPGTLREIREDTDSWRDPVHGQRSRIGYARFFRENYRRVVELHRVRGE